MLLRATRDGCLALAPAKINLSLEILGKRPDGYHELRTVMAPLRWYDTLRLARGVDSASPGVIDDAGLRCQLRVIEPARGAGGAPADASNLVVRALAAVAARAGRPLSVTATLFKRIPSQAGLGGGSSDAAAAIVGANRLWDLGLSLDELRAIGASLGSDVPFFVEVMASNGQHRAACAEGRGERLRCVPSRSVACVVIKPREGLSTPEVYSNVMADDFGDHRSAPAAIEGLATGAWRRVAGRLTNALQAAAARCGAFVEELHAAFRGLPVLAHQLSGSGSAYFALCANRRVALRVAAAARTKKLGQVAVTATL